MKKRKTRNLGYCPNCEKLTEHVETSRNGWEVRRCKVCGCEQRYRVR